MLIGFVISLSSTAVVMKRLQDRKEFDSKAGQDVLVTLLAQGLAVIPMLITLAMLGGTEQDTGNIWLQLAGAFLMTVLVAYIAAKRHSTFH